MKTNKQGKGGILHFYIIYFIFAAIFYFFSAITLNIVAYSEYGDNYWPIASTYPALFLFQLNFLPIILIFLAKPIREYIEFIKSQINEKKKRLKILAFWPITLVIVLAIVGSYIEFSQNSIAIWEVSPATKNSEDVEVEEDGSKLKEEFNKYFSNFSWNYSKIWPAIFNYLQDLDKVIKYKEDRDNSEEELRKLKKLQDDHKKKYTSFLTLEKLTSNNIDQSSTRFWYMVSFTMLLLCALSALCLSVFFTSIKLAFHKQDNQYRDSLLSLCVVLFCYFCWLPMRAVTTNIKKSLYTDIDPTGDLLLAFAFLVAAVSLSIPWLIEHRDRMIGVTTLVLAAISIFASYIFPEEVSLALKEKRFYIGLSVLVCIPILGFWTFFSQKREK